MVTLLLLNCGCVERTASKRLPPAPGRPVVLDFWNGFTGPDGKTMEALARRFQAENPDVAVRMQIIPWGTY